MRTIGEVSAAFGIKPHVLRYWEQQFPMLRPLKRGGGRRLYRAEDLALVAQIDRLVNCEGYTLKGALQAIRGGKAVAARAEAPVTGPAAAKASGDVAGVVGRLREIRERLAQVVDS